MLSKVLFESGKSANNNNVVIDVKSGKTVKGDFDKWEADRKKRLAAKKSKPRKITTANGWELEWTKKGDPTAEDWARLKAWDDQQGPNPAKQPDKSYAVATDAQGNERPSGLLGITDAVNFGNERLGQFLSRVLPDIQGGRKDLMGGYKDPSASLKTGELATGILGAPGEVVGELGVVADPNPETGLADRGKAILSALAQGLGMAEATAIMRGASMTKAGYGKLVQRFGAKEANRIKNEVADIGVTFRPKQPVEAPPTKTSAAPKAKETPKVGKEPWEMTREELLEGKPWEMTRDQHRRHRAFYGMNSATDLPKLDFSHKSDVEFALKEGKPVPAEVLADYPDLAAKYGTKPPTTPPIAPKGGETGGINRADRVKDAEELGTNKPVTIKGKSHAELEAQGQKAVSEGFDFEDELAELAKGARPATDEQVGIFKAGRDSLKAELKKLNARLDKGDVSAVEERQALLERIADFDRNLDEVKGAGGRSLSAYKIGQTVDFGDIDEVLLEARRIAPSQVRSGSEKQFRQLTVERNKALTKAAELEAELAAARAKGGTRGARTVEKVRATRQEIFAEIDEILKGGVAHDIGSAAYDAVRFSKAAGRLALNYAQEGVAKLDDIVERVITDFKARGIEIDRQQILDEMAEPKPKPELTPDELTKKELQAQIATLRAQAKRESSGNRAKIEAQIAEAKRQLDKGYYRVPTKRELVISKELEAQRDLKNLYESKTRSALDRLMRPQPNLAVRTAKEVSGVGKIITLGSDFGAVLRQGIFGISNPKAYGKALASAKKAIRSEADLVKLERQSLEVRYQDGKLAEKVRRKAGLSRSSVGDPEEGYLIGMLDKLLGGTIGKIPGLKNVGGALGRGQAALLNKLRNEMFDDFYIRHGGNATEQELKDWANYLNSALGRSAAYGSKKTPSELAQIVLTSPRYEASRWEMVSNYLTSPATAVKAFKDKAARAKIINMASTGATVLGTLKILSAYTDSELVLDPESSDFLKLRMGDKVIDLTAGISPRLRGVIRAFYFFKDPEAKTQYRKADGQPYKRNETLPKEILAATTRPVSPFVTSAIEERTGYSLSGWREDEGDPKGWERLMPLIAQGFKQDYEKGGYSEALKNVGIEFFGGSVQRYPAKKGK